MMPREKKDDDEYEVMPFQSLQKGSVLQETRLFNDSPLNSRKCCLMLTKLIYLIAQGETFTESEATDVFFSATKLFQSQDVVLRRLLYLGLKELTPMASDVIIVISSLSKDMNSTTDVYRANSIRVLCTILNDISMLGQGERYLKQAIVDKDPYVASSALVSGYHLLHRHPGNADVIKRWFNEVQDAAKSKYTMVQYHALGLLYKLRQHDRLAVSKLVVSIARTSVRSPYAHCLLIRLATRIMGENESIDRTLFDYLESCLRHKNDMVELEAARAICNLKNVTPKDLTSSVSVLQLFLSSPKPSVRFAAVRTLSALSNVHPSAVTSCNIDMETLITDVNRSIATLAITTLLKTGSESSVDRLMKTIGSFMNEISDDFKMVVIDAISTLCVKRTLMNFLSSNLRDEGGLQYKTGIVDAILKIVDMIPESKEAGLSHLCEFIEDCEYPSLCTRVLFVLGEKGTSTSCPSKFIRYIYNRLILENALVRSSAVNALAKFGRRLPALRPSVIVLLTRCLRDSDDEVRDRATFHLKYLQHDSSEAKMSHDIVDKSLGFPIENLQEALKGYLSSGAQSPFDVASVSTEKKLTPQQRFAEKEMAEKSSSVLTTDSYTALLAQIPELVGLGPLFTSSKPVELTESETEYTVNCVIHTFPEHLVFQFNCTNTLDDQQLSNVTVAMEPDDPDSFEIEQEIPLAVLAPGTSGMTYTVATRPADVYSVGSFLCTLKFSSSDVDPATGDVEEDAFEDEYNLEELEMTAAEYMRKRMAVNFGKEWDEMGDDSQVVERFALTTMKSLTDAVDKIIEFLGMQAVDQSQTVPDKATKHILYLSGTFIGDVPVLVRARMVPKPNAGVMMELAIRSPNPDVAEVLLAVF